MAHNPPSYLHEWDGAHAPDVSQAGQVLHQPLEQGQAECMQLATRVEVSLGVVGALTTLRLHRGAGHAHTARLTPGPSGGALWCRVAVRTAATTH